MAVPVVRYYCYCDFQTMETELSCVVNSRAHDNQYVVLLLFLFVTGVTHSWEQGHEDLERTPHIGEREPSQDHIHVSQMLD
jgi:hypothetical protein